MSGQIIASNSEVRRKSYDCSTTSVCRESVCVYLVTAPENILSMMRVEMAAKYTHMQLHIKDERFSQ